MQSNQSDRDAPRLR